ncbi:MAG: glutamine cyclotransferase [Deltaproteobacteria bacterium]|nr:glutamine cyclotransferase [Deltaproteobacteria bacterium]
MRGAAEVVREYGPFGEGGVHGVTFDGELVWFARTGELVAFDPSKEEVVRRLAVPADAGTAFDGENLYQLAGQEILVLRPADGRVLRRMPAPGKGKDSGMAYADGYLWVGAYREAKIHQVDAKTGAVVKTLSSDRWVTGVSCVDGALWHATTSDDGAPGEIRRLGPDGAVEESIGVPEGLFVSGLERTKDGTFWCGGGSSGKLRRMRKKVA